jgi:hypothetical protein
VEKVDETLRRQDEALVMDDTFDGFDLLGAEAVKPSLSVKRLALAVTAGALGAVLVPKHPILAFFNGAALASNVLAVEEGERSWPDAFKRLGRHLVATAGSLALPKYPGIGYVAGAMAADLFIDREGGGIIEEWADFEGVAPTAPNDNIIDAEIVSDNTKALVKR